MKTNRRITRPARTLDEIFATLSPEPLVDPEDFEAFYRGDVNDVRGDDKVERLKFGLLRAHNATYFKAFVIGHTGVGKSTELTRLAREVDDHYEAIRFSATNDMDAISFRPFDVIFVMMAEVAERTRRSVEEGGTGVTLSEGALREILEWFASERTVTESSDHVGVGVEVGVGAGEGSLLQKVLGIFANVKSEMRFAADRRREIVEYRLSRLSKLVSLANTLLDECNVLLREATGREWLFMGEDFDRPGVAPARVEETFVTNANIFEELRAHMIFTIPVDLAYSQLAPRLIRKTYCIPDVPVYGKDHGENEEGRNAIRSILEARVAAKLFDAGQIDRLVVASGGNIRDLFVMALDSCETALLGKKRKIAAEHVERAINEMRTAYKRRLGEGPHDRDKVTYEEKLRRLASVYRREPMSDRVDEVLYALLRSRTVLEFNGKRWFGVHPFAVDILIEEKVLEQGNPGGTI